MQILDNINRTVRSDLQATIKKGSQLSIAAACFSIYAYQELKKQLDGIEPTAFHLYLAHVYSGESAQGEARVLHSPG